jgi:hypothetical protein
VIIYRQTTTGAVLATIALKAIVPMGK